MGELTRYGVFTVLVGATIAQLMLIGQPLPSSLRTASIMSLAGMQALLVALFFQNLKDEPRPLSLLPIAGLAAAAILLTMLLLMVQVTYVPA